MTTEMTVFRATLVQDSAMSVSGVERVGAADRLFTMVDGRPVLSGRSMKGAAVAMARRYFEPLPQLVSDDASRGTSLKRSVWEFANASPTDSDVALSVRSGVGILQETGARALGVLHDREVVPAGTCWNVEFRVDLRQADPALAAEAVRAEAILGYVLFEHWAKGRCWLGGDVARGLGWCHLEGLTVHRLDRPAYDTWVSNRRSPKHLPDATSPPERPKLDRGWCFRTLDVDVSFGEYRPGGPKKPSWGLDMLAIGPHDVEKGSQILGDRTEGTWAAPAWASGPMAVDAVDTDRAIVMTGGRPLLPGSSVRGPLRHEMSRARRSKGVEIEDPNLCEGKVGKEDLVGDVFGTVRDSSRVLICDAIAEPGWSAARLHQHAEDEFTASTYLSSKRDAVRLLDGRFTVRIVVEGERSSDVEPTVTAIDELVALGGLGHLPIGGHKMRGAGWGRWAPREWDLADTLFPEGYEPPAAAPPPAENSSPGDGVKPARESAWQKYRSAHRTVSVLRRSGRMSGSSGRLHEAVEAAKAGVGDNVVPIAWWCEPAINFDQDTAPESFGTGWPAVDFAIDEACFFFDTSVWQVVRVDGVLRWTLLEEVDQGGDEVDLVETPVRLHGDTTRFATEMADTSGYLVREWRAAGVSLGFTLNGPVEVGK